MNNIQKAFKNKAKRGLRMASGGVTPGYVSSIPDMSAMRPPGMANTPAAPSPMLAGQRAAPMANNLASGSPAAPTGGPMPGQPVQSGGLSHQLGNQIAMGTAVAGLSNTDRAHLENPNNAKYGVAGPAPGSSAEASQMGQQLDIQKQLMSGLQAQGMADGGVAETPDQLMARMAAKYGGAPAPAAQAQAPAPVAPAPAPAPVAPAPKPAGGLFSNFNNLVQKHKAAIDAAGMADGGVANHMVYGDGPKGVDSVPAELAPGEGVIPAKMVDEYFGGPAKLEHLIESFTGKPTATRHGLRGQLHAASGTGGVTPEEQNPAYPKGLTPRPEGEGVFGGRSVGQMMYDVAASPERRAIDSGTATPDQITKEQKSVALLRATDTPFDVAGPMAPLGVAARGLSKAPGMLDKAAAMASDAGTAVKGLFTRTPKAAAPVAEAAASPAASAASAATRAEAEAAPVMQAAAAPDRTRAAADTADYLASKAAQDAKFATAATDAANAAKIVAPGAVSKTPVARPLGAAANALYVENTPAPVDRIRAAHDKIMAGGQGNPLAPIPPEVKAQLVAERKARGLSAAREAGTAPDQRFTPSADQTRSIRSGGMSNQPNDPTFHRGTSATDATAMQAPDGGGYITNRAGKAMFVEGQKAPARDPNKTYDADGNDMTRTNGMKAQLAEMQKARFLSEATATNGAYHEGGKTGYAAMQAQDAVNLGNRNAATEEVKSKGLLAHYKQLEQQQAASLAMQRYGVQVKQRDDMAALHKEYLDSQFMNPADGKPMVAERTRFNRDLQHVMSSAGIQHPGDLTRKDLLEIQAMSEAIQRKEKNNEGWGGVVERLKGNKPRVGGNPLEQQFGHATPGVFGAGIKAGDGTGHYVSSIQGGGAMPWSGPIDSNIEGVLNRHSQR